ncbi:MAG TPA: MFS transporter [Pirellulales bacterium]|nr:MFS transporter [Pirellulales bacterium]
MRQGVVGLFVLFGALYFIQGVNETGTGLVYQPVNSLLKDWRHSADEITTFMALLSVPWCLKPLFGLLSDFVPLAGMRRKSYLLATGVITSICFLGLARLPLAHDSRWLLLAVLMLPTLAVTFGDVVLDALIIEAGQLFGLTARLQSVRWGASSLAAILTGSVAGLLTEHDMHHVAFLACGLLAAAALVVSATFVREPPPTVIHEDFKTVKQTLREALHSRTFLMVGGFLFVWHLNPCTSPLIYLRMTVTLDFSEQFYGFSNTLLSCGSAAACAVYSFYCHRLSMRAMVPGAIACGIISTLSYFLMTNEASAAAISVLVGFTYMTANLIQCDLAARVCPVHAAGTVFAIFMALCNVGTDISMWLGGHLYELVKGHRGPDTAFQATMLVGAALTLGSWSVARLIPRDENDASGATGPGAVHGND